MTTPVLEVYQPKREASVAFADLVALTKPRVTALVVVTTAGGLWLAPVKTGPVVGGLAILGTVLIVAGANALNMYVERETDGLMKRTENRPLPAGRLPARVALWFGIAVSVAAMPILALGVNALTALLAAFANLSYVLAYTPMKRRSPAAVLVGAVPGATPPLLGWTAATGAISAGGLVLFGILFFWQIAHFHAIGIFRGNDYKRAGLMVMFNTHGLRDTKHSIVRHLVALVGVSVLLVPLGVENTGYLISAGLLGAIFLGWGCYGLRSDAGPRWARSLFGISILYLTLLFCALVVHARQVP